EAPNSSPLSRFRHVGDAKGCVLDGRLAQRPAPENAWVLMRPPDPDALVVQLALIGDRPQRFGEFVIARLPLRRHTVAAALRAGARAYHAADIVSGPVTDFGIVASNYRIALALLRAGRC